VKSPGTTEDLLADARAARFPATERMITDWIGLGLLDHPTRQSLGRHRGSAKALYSPNQRQLFVALLDQRNRTTDGQRNVRRVVTLTNIPVWLWLTAGDSYVPRRQVRIAMRTFTNAFFRVSETRGNHSARELLDQIAHPNARPRDRRHFIQVTSRGATSGTFDHTQFLAAARAVIDPLNTGLVTSAQAAIIDDLATAIEARFAAISIFDQLSNNDYERARWIYRQSWSDYARTRTVQPHAAPDEIFEQLPNPTTQQRINEACGDLVTLLGMGVLYRRDNPGTPN
jgi:hypothetical protein